MERGHEVDHVLLVEPLHTQRHISGEGVPGLSWLSFAHEEGAARTIDAFGAETGGERQGAAVNLDIYHVAASANREKRAGRTVAEI